MTYIVKNVTFGVKMAPKQCGRTFLAANALNFFLRRKASEFGYPMIYCHINLLSI